MIQPEQLPFCQFCRLEQPNSERLPHLDFAVVTRSRFDQMPCDCGRKHDEINGHVFYPVCHFGAGFHAEYCKQHGILTLFCIQCGETKWGFIIGDASAKVTTQRRSPLPGQAPSRRATHIGARTNGRRLAPPTDQ